MATPTRRAAFLAALAIIPLLFFSTPLTADLMVGNSCFLD
jgi:hypothetical protein